MELVELEGQKLPCYHAVYALFFVASLGLLFFSGAKDGDASSGACGQEVLRLNYSYVKLPVTD